MRRPTGEHDLHTAITDALEIAEARFEARLADQALAHEEMASGLAAEHERQARGQPVAHRGRQKVGLRDLLFAAAGIVLLCPVLELELALPVAVVVLEADLETVRRDVGQGV